MHTAAEGKDTDTDNQNHDTGDTETHADTQTLKGTYRHGPLTSCVVQA